MFLNSSVFNYGPPEELVDDNIVCITAKFFQDVCSIISIDKTVTTLHHSQSNEQFERYNRTILAHQRT